MNDVEVLGKRAKQKGGGEVGEVMLMIVAEERHKSWDSKQNRKCV